MSSQIPAGQTKAEAVTRLRENGQGTLADMISSMRTWCLGQGVDFAAVGRVPMTVLVIYQFSAVGSPAQGRGNHDHRAARGVPDARAGPGEADPA